MVAMVRLLSVTLSGALTRSLSSRDVLLGDSDTTPSSRPRGSSFGVDVELGWVPDQGRSPYDYGRDRWLPVRRCPACSPPHNSPRRNAASASPFARGPRPPAPRAAPPPRAPRVHESILRVPGRTW